MEDRVDRLVSDLAALRPDMAPGVKAVAARLLHLSDLVLRYYSAVTEPFGVSLSGLGVLTSLARHAPQRLTLTELNRDILVTSGGITFVVSQLEKQGLVVKNRHPGDGRAVLVGLTRRGRRIADELIDAVARADAAAFGGSDALEQDQAQTVLRRLQAGIESTMTAAAASAPT